MATSLAALVSADLDILFREFDLLRQIIIRTLNYSFNNIIVSGSHYTQNR